MGMCLYNRGRVFEEEGEPDRARDYYLNSLAFRENSTVQARIDALPGSAEDTPTDLASLLAPASEPLACEGPFERLEDALAEFDYETEVRDEGPVGAHRVRVIAHGDDLSAGPDLFVALQAGGFWHLSQRPLVMGMGRTAFAHTEVLGFEFEMARAASGQPVLLIESRVSDSDYPCADMYWDPEGENEEFLAREECQASTSVTTELALLSLEDKCLTERARYVLRVETGETDCHLNREVSDGHLVLAAGSGPPNCLDQLSPPGRFPLLP